MAIKTTKTRAAAALDQVLLNINSGGGPGFCDLYTGAAPADLATPATGTRLAHCTQVNGTSPAFANTDTTTLLAAGNNSTFAWWAEDTNPAATGTIGYFEITDSFGTAVIRGTVSLASGGGDIEFNTLNVTAGVLVRITTMSVSITGIT